MPNDLWKWCKKESNMESNCPLSRRKLSICYNLTSTSHNLQEYTHFGYIIVWIIYRRFLEIKMIFWWLTEGQNKIIEPILLHTNFVSLLIRKFCNVIGKIIWCYLADERSVNIIGNEWNKIGWTDWCLVACESVKQTLTKMKQRW